MMSNNDNNKTLKELNIPFPHKNKNPQNIPSIKKTTQKYIIMKLLQINGRDNLKGSQKEKKAYDI